MKIETTEIIDWKIVVNFLIKEQYKKNKYESDAFIEDNKFSKSKKENPIKFRVDHLRIQKMLYFIYGLYYSETKQKLFNLEFEAWPYGPVARKAYFYIKKIMKKIDENDNFIKENKSDIYYEKLNNNRTFKSILNFLDDKSTYRLVQDSHTTYPYESTNLNELIDNEKILDYFLKINKNE